LRKSLFLDGDSKRRFIDIGLKKQILGLVFLKSFRETFLPFILKFLALELRLAAYERVFQDDVISI
jgi:hypothetical protein